MPSSPRLMLARTVSPGSVRSMKTRPRCVWLMPSPLGPSASMRISPAMGSASRFREFGDELDMMREGELVDHLHAVEAIGAIEQDARIARESRGVARDRDEHRHG